MALSLWTTPTSPANASERFEQARAMIYSVTYGCDLENVSKPRALVDEDLQADFVWPENPARLR